MKKFLDAMRVIGALLPLVIQLVRDLEDLIPDSGRGSDKLAMLREIIEDAFEALGDVPVVFAEVWPALERVVARFVAIFNAIGEFRTS